jgi:hypothetical protein
MGTWTVKASASSIELALVIESWALGVCRWLVVES